MSDQDECQSPKKFIKKRKFIPTPQKEKDKMPYKWAHIRDGERRVKSEFYLVVDKMISVYHCSRIQAVAGVINCGNIMFKREWKFCDEEKDIIDLDTAPLMTCIRRSGKSIGEYHTKNYIIILWKVISLYISY